MKESRWQQTREGDQGVIEYLRNLVAWEHDDIKKGRWELPLEEKLIRETPAGADIQYPVVSQLLRNACPTVQRIARQAEERSLVQEERAILLLALNHRS